MTESKGSLMRVCSNCGLNKPLNAFLQLSSSAGELYGNICGTCRGNLPKQQDAGETAEGTSGRKIDSKAKIHEALEKRLIHQQTKDADSELLKKKEEHQLKTADELTITRTKEREHRETFLDKPHRYEKFGRQQNANAVKNRAIKQQTIDEHHTKLHQQSEDRKKGLDLDTTFVDLQQPEVRMQNSLFMQFRTWLGGSSAIGRAGLKENQKAAAKEPQKKQDAAKKILDYIEENFSNKPNKPRK